MFTQNLIDEIYKAIKESGKEGNVYVNTETMEVGDYISDYIRDIKIFYNNLDRKERNKARIEFALLDYYRR